MRHIPINDARIIRVSRPFWWYRANGSLETVLGGLMNKRTWRRHPEPFSKSRRGKMRRQERAFVERNNCGFGCD